MMDHHPLVVIVVYTLAAARVTRLVTMDSITEPLRDAVVGWLDNRPRTVGAALATLITCPWCTGVWVAAATVGIVAQWGDSPAAMAPAAVLALAQAIGMITVVGGDA